MARMRSHVAHGVEVPMSRIDGRTGPGAGSAGTCVGSMGLKLRDGDARNGTVRYRQRYGASRSNGGFWWSILQTELSKCGLAKWVFLQAAIFREKDPQEPYRTECGLILGTHSNRKTRLCGLILTFNPNYPCQTSQLDTITSRYFGQNAIGLMHLIYTWLLTGYQSTSGEEKEPGARKTSSCFLSRRFRRFRLLRDENQGKGSVPNSDRTDNPCLP